VIDKPGNKVSQSVRFVILDIDDNPPMFKNTPYRVDVMENTPINTIVFDQVEAQDIDGPLYNKFTFSLPNTTYDNNLFSLDKTSYVASGQYATNVILRESLDYEKAKAHIVNIVAIGENSHYMTSAELLINVLDFPDRKPEFSQSPYYVKIEEEMPVVSIFLNFS
jgi:hypothetical protein